MLLQWISCWVYWIHDSNTMCSTRQQKSFGRRNFCGKKFSRVSAWLWNFSLAKNFTLYGKFEVTSAVQPHYRILSHATLHNTKWSRKRQQRIRSLGHLFCYCGKSKIWWRHLANCIPVAQFCQKLTLCTAMELSLCAHACSFSYSPFTASVMVNNSRLFTSYSPTRLGRPTTWHFFCWRKAVRTITSVWILPSQDKFWASLGAIHSHIIP